MTKLKVRSIGNSTGIILSKEILQRLRISKGNSLYVLETPNGVELTPYDPAFGKQMNAAESVMRKNRDVLRKLAK
ncbi:MAG TPA: AbrB/MazE/SpoVT family DNA-binding domain-containing protein [Phycisphaerae bacterium]|nr:AbrB/MazE/SpoVT family DNA-binding domain-containing protein [Phycisphaerae bacterium]